MMRNKNILPHCNKVVSDGQEKEILSYKISTSIKEVTLSCSKFKVAEHFRIKETESSNPYLEIGCVEHFLKALEDASSGLMHDGLGFIIYNGKYWESIAESYLKEIIGEFSELVGITVKKSRHYMFRETLMKQLTTSVKKPKKLEHDDLLINFQNGTLSIGRKKIEFRDFQKQDYLRYILTFDYNADAKWDQFQCFLDEVIDKENQDIIAEFLGSSFDNTIKHEKALINYGTGANGKSVLFDIIQKVLGKANVTNFSMAELTEDTGKYRIQIANKLLNLGSELSTRQIESAPFKKMCSGEALAAKELYKNPVTIERYARLAFNCNELPYPSERNMGYFRRFLIIPFDVIIPVEKRDQDLARRIIDSELSGIFNWILAGLVRLRFNNGNFTKSASSEKMLESYIRETDSVGMFIDDNYVPSENKKELIALKSLYVEYTNFCDDGGYKPVNISKFKKRLIRLGFENKRTAKGNVIFGRKYIVPLTVGLDLPKSINKTDSLTEGFSF